MRPRSTARRSTLLVALAMALVTPLACRSATEPGERIHKLYVGATRVPCTGMFPQQCLQVRERTDEPYTLFYDTIDGFSYEPGYEYLLEVDERTISNPPADGSSTAYRLISVLAKTAAAP